MTQQREIWIACGGTGGHFMPGVVVGRALTERGFVVRYWGEGKKIEENLCAAQHVELLRPKEGSRWNRWLQLQKMMNQQAKLNRPSMALLFGGFSSFALGSWAFLHGVPYSLFEQNAVPGRVNRILSWNAKSAILTFPLSKYKLNCPTRQIGNPVRTPPQREEAEWDVMILGGSQGATALNQKLPQLLDPSLKVIHICGPGKLNEAQKAWQGKAVDLRESDPNVPDLLARCRWVISRSGATSLSEMAAAGSAVICVPYPHAKDDHQRFNAQHLETMQASYVLEEADFDVKAEWLNQVLKDTEQQSNLEKNLLNSGLADVGGKAAIDFLFP